jgi:Mce-associated membrane protein
MSKHNQDQTAEDQTTVPSDPDTEQVEDKAVEDSTETADEATETADEATETADEATETADEATETADEATETPEEATETADAASESAEPEEPKRRVQWARVFALGVLPAVALLLALSAGYLKWMDDSARVNDINSAKSPAREAMQTAKDSTMALLSYKPDTVEQQLTAARDLLTGDFRDSYTSLTNELVIPGAKQKQISAVATVPAVASVSADPRHAVVLVFVNQTVIVGQDAPTGTASSVRVTLDKIGNRWLISKFDPV